MPTISSLKETAPAAIPAIYRESYRLIFFLALPIFSFLVAVSPIVSNIWVGHYEPIFVHFVILLAAGWLANILSNPAYVVDLGIGALRWVSVGCAVTGIINLSLGYCAGKYFGGTAVVVVASSSLIIGYAIVLVAYHLENRVSFRELFPTNSAGIVCASAFAVIGFLPYFCRVNVWSLSSVWMASALILALLTMMIFPMWLHPMRKRLLRWVFSSLPA